MALVLLPPSLTAEFAVALKARLLKALGEDGPLTLDGGRVESLSTPCLQVLLGACVSAAHSGTRLVLRDPSPELRAALADLGLGGDAPWEMQE